MDDLITSHAEPFEYNPRQTQIANAIMPDGFINRQVAVVVNVDGAEFTWLDFDIAEQFSLPDDRIGRLSRANEIDFGDAKQTASVETRGFASPVPRRDIRVARAQRTVDPLTRATTSLTNLAELAREAQVANLIFDENSYLSGSRETLSGTDQWSDDGSDPVGDIEDGINSPLVKPNSLVLGQKTWTKLRKNPKIVEAVRGTGAGANAIGLVTREEVAELFELERLIVGMTRKNTANKGQAANYTRLWGNHAALLNIDMDFADPEGSVPTFCFMAEWEGREVGTYFDPERGKSGTEVVKVAEDRIPIVCSKNAGYFFKNAVA